MLVLLPCSHVFAALEFGDLVGVASGNDSEDAILMDFGLELELLAKIDIPDLDNDDLSISDLILKEENEPISGQWSYSGFEQVDYIVIKAGNNYALYDFTNVAMSNMGLWDTTDLPTRGKHPKGLSHITAYSSTTVIPLPPAWILLLSSSSLLMAGRRWSKSHKHK